MTINTVVTTLTPTLQQSANHQLHRGVRTPTHIQEVLSYMMQHHSLLFRFIIFLVSFSLWRLYADVRGMEIFNYFTNNA